MSKIKIILSVLFAFLVAFSSTQDNYIHRPFTFSFFPPVSSNGMEYWKVRTNFSFSIIGGAVGRLEGFELASVFGIEKDGARGVQISGVFNLIGNSFEGIHLTGGANIVEKNLRGWQVAGGANVVGETGKGIQLAGGANILGKELEGIQMAGGANITGENFKGLQISGGANITGKDMTGIQITGGANITGEDMKGFQIAPVNIATTVKGFQLGVVNISENMEGEALGVVTIAGNGQFHVNAWADEVAPFNLGFKLGTRRIYNLWGLGIKPFGDTVLLLATGGLGWHLPLNQYFMNLEVTGSSIRRGFNFKEWENTILSRFRIIGGWQVLPKLAITAGPTLSVYVSTSRDGLDLPIYDATIYSNHSGDSWIRIWPGFAAGIQIF